MIGTVLLVSSFIPILQILIMQVNGAVLYVFNVFFTDVGFMQYGVNGIIAATVLFIYFGSRKLAWKIGSAIFATIFILPLITYSLENVIDEESFYFLSFMIAGVGTGFVLLVVGFLKERAEFRLKS